MTREEALKELKEYEDGLDMEYATPFDKAILYAIKALEQEPTTKNDLAVDCIVDVLGSYTDLDIPYKREIAENILTKLPSVTPQEPTLDELRAEITTLQNRCYALTKGTMCAFCKYECEYKAEQEAEDA